MQCSIENTLKAFPDLKIPVIDGESRLVYEPDAANPNTWFVNDHCLLEDSQGRIHFFGIENPYPSVTQVRKAIQARRPSDSDNFVQEQRLLLAQLYQPSTHCRIGHAVADNIWGPWTRCEAAMDGKRAGKMYGSPFVVFHEDQYWMLLPSQSTMATSKDLYQWQDFTPPTSPSFNMHGWRDPCVIRLDDGTFLQYFAGGKEENVLESVIHLARTKDLLSWEYLGPCFSKTMPQPCARGTLESPAVIYHEGLYYLFVCLAHRRYYETLVVASY